ncbi:MAG: TonB-dependent receptor, partial [Acidobacteriaceae bacterium]|nr:TonB-dependent receptor [Acidobacteriaceae bacterium]
MTRIRTRLGFVLRLVPVLTALSVLPGNNLEAQAISGNLVGTVLDSTGATVPNATVTARNTGTDIKSTVNTNANGEYRLNNLLPGTYDLTVSASGFSASTTRNVAVQLNQTTTIPVTLQVGTVSTSVVVSEAGAQIDTTTAQIQNTFSTKQATDLPNASIGQGVINLSLLNAGVGSSGAIGVGTGPSVGGQRPRNNNFTIEGVDNNSKTVTGPVVYLPNESVAEFTLLQNQFQAEFGHSSGGQFNTVVKSGTNEYHGTVYDYLQNRNLNAVDQTYKNQGLTNNPRFDRNHLGANVGGPIKKNKLFFFTSFEYNPLGQATTPGTPVYAPTAAGYATLAAIPGVNQTNLNVLKTYAIAPSVQSGSSVPKITIGNVSVPTGIIPIAAPNYQNADYGVASADYSISDKDQLRGRFIYNRYDTINTGANLPAFYTTVASRYYLGSLAEYHTFNPTLTNELRLAYQRSDSASPVGDQSFPGLSAFPNLQFNDLHLQVGPNPNYPQSGVNNLYQFVDNVSWTKGAHTIKFGTEFRDYISPVNFVQRVRGDYEWTTVANYLLDQSPDYFAARSFGGGTYYGNQYASYSYLQDTWRVRPNLTLDLGVRYEYTTVAESIQAQSLNAIANAPGLLTFQSPSADPHGIAPRVGIAWSPGGSTNTVIRAGFSMAYDVLFDNLGENSVPPQFYTTVTLPTTVITNNFLANGGITQGASGPMTVAQARAATSSWIPNQQLPYAINYTFDVQHVFARDYTLDVRYLGTKGVHQVLQTQINRQSPVTATQNIPTFLAVPSLATLASLPLTVGNLQAIGSAVPAFQAAGFTNTITSYQPSGYSDYNGLAVQLNRRFSNGLQFQGAYTWSHLIDNSTAEVASTYLTPRRPQDFFNLSADKSSSALDHRHRITLSMVYDAPWLKTSNNWFAKNLAGNWEFVPVYTYESPEYVDVQSGLDSNLNGDSAGDRTI